MAKQDKQHPRRRERRKEDRPAEIVAAALEVFADQGFGASRIAEVAQRAGVSKATVFVYFPTKEDLFRAVARTAVAANFEALQPPAAASSATQPLPLEQLVPLLLRRAAAMGDSRVGALARLLIGESRAFPDLARVWHDEVVARLLGLLVGAIAHAQSQGRCRAGDPRLHAFSILGPMMAGMIFRQVFAPTGAEPPDLPALAEQHAATVLRGLAP